MKRKIRKMIVAGITVCAIMVPTVASAYSQGAAWGWEYETYITKPEKCYGWASYEYHTCYVTIYSGYNSASGAGWGHAETEYLPVTGSPSVSAKFD